MAEEVAGGTMARVCTGVTEVAKPGNLDTASTTAADSAAASSSQLFFTAAQPCGAQLLQRGHVALEDGLGLGERGHGAVDALLAQQVQRGVRRAVGGVGDVVGLGVGELEARVEAGHLQHAVEVELVDGRVGQLEEIVEVLEVGEYPGMYHHRGVDEVGIGVGQALQLHHQRREQPSASVASLRT